MKVYGIVVAAGSGKRLGDEKNKVLLPLLGRPLLAYALNALRPFCQHLCLVIRKEDRLAVEGILKQEGLKVDALVEGGKERRHSVENALKNLPDEDGIVLVHDGARPLPSPIIIRKIIDAAMEHTAAVPALPVQDTLRSLEGHTVSRAGLFTVQTPQGFHTSLLKQAYAACPEALTDDAGLVERLGVKIALVPGDARNIKITRREDLHMAEAWLLGDARTGLGFDTHRLVVGRALVLCGVTIPHETGLLGHSDADAALHALTDALLGACALGDIGTHFPDSQEAYRGVSSLKLLEETRRILKENGFVPWQADVTILAQAPKLLPYIPQMRQNIANALEVPVERVSVKATTTEGLGPEGRKEGISAQALAVVRQIN